jgi:hypothetical protein
MTLKTELLIQQQQVIKNAVAVLNGDLGEEARRCFLRFLNAQKRAEMRRVHRLKLIVAKLPHGFKGPLLAKRANTAASSIHQLDAHQLVHQRAATQVIGTRSAALPVAD